MSHTHECAIRYIMARDAGDRLECVCGEWDREDKIDAAWKWLESMAPIAYVGCLRSQTSTITDIHARFAALESDYNALHSRSLEYMRLRDDAERRLRRLAEACRTRNVDKDWPALKGLLDQALGLVEAPTPKLENHRCAWCGWSLTGNVNSGCVRGNCSLRPLPEKLYDYERAMLEATSKTTREYIRTHYAIPPAPVSLDTHKADGAPTKVEYPSDHASCNPDCCRVLADEAGAQCGCKGGPVSYICPVKGVCNCGCPFSVHGHYGCECGCAWGRCEGMDVPMPKTPCVHDVNSSNHKPEEK